MDTEIVAMIGSSIVIVVGAFLWQKGDLLLSNGKRVAATVLMNNYKHDKNGGTYFPVVQFLNHKQESITQELNIGVSPAIPEGTKLEVIYDPDNPTDVYLNSGVLLVWLPRILVAFGSAVLILAVLEYLEITHLFES